MPQPSAAHASGANDPVRRQPLRGLELLDRRVCARAEIAVRAHLVTGRFQLGLQQGDACVLVAPAKDRCGGGYVWHAHAKGCLCLRQIGLAIVQPVQPTVDLPGDRLDVIMVSELVQTAALPKLARDPQRNYRFRCGFRVVREVKPQGFSGTPRSSRAR